MCADIRRWRVCDKKRDQRSSTRKAWFSGMLSNGRNFPVSPPHICWPFCLGIMPEFTWVQSAHKMSSLSVLLPTCHSAIWCLLSVASCYHRGHCPETKYDSKSQFKSQMHLCFGKNIAFSLFNSCLFLGLSKCSLTFVRCFWPRNTIVLSH